MTAVEQQTASAIRPFRLQVPEEALTELRHRLAETRWPPKELVDDPSQGVQTATLQALARYWVTEYDFGRVAARLNALPQFKTEIDGLDVHFLHVRSPHAGGAGRECSVPTCWGGAFGPSRVPGHRGQGCGRPGSRDRVRAAREALADPRPGLGLPPHRVPTEEQSNDHR
jgi:hypothetical protein